MNPYVVEVLGEEGLDIFGNSTKSVFDLYQSQKQYDAVIAVCSQAASGKCPIFPGRVKRWNWPFNEPSRLADDRELMLAQTREIRDEIKNRILSFIREYDEKGVKLFP